MVHTEKFLFHLKPVIEQYKIHYEFFEEAYRPRVLILVSKFDHCLHDLLYRWKKGTLEMDIIGVVSNHETARFLTEANDVPYYYFPVFKDNKQEQEEKL